MLFYSVISACLFETGCLAGMELIKIFHSSAFQVLGVKICVTVGGIVLIFYLNSSAAAHLRREEERRKKSRRGVGEKEEERKVNVYVNTCYFCINISLISIFSSAVFFSFFS